LHLAIQDENGANQSFNTWCSKPAGFVNSEEGRIAHDLLTGFETSDQNLIDDCLASNAVKFLDNELVKLVQHLKTMAVKTSQQVTSLQEEIEEEGFL
jgi:hypothetical protein